MCYIPVTYSVQGNPLPDGRIWAFFVAVTSRENVTHNWCPVGSRGQECSHPTEDIKVSSYSYSYSLRLVLPLRILKQGESRLLSESCKTKTLYKYIFFLGGGEKETSLYLTCRCAIYGLYQAQPK